MRSVRTTWAAVREVRAAQGRGWKVTAMRSVWAVSRRACVRTWGARSRWLKNGVLEDLRGARGVNLEPSQRRSNLLARGVRLDDALSVRCLVR